MDGGAIVVPLVAGAVNAGLGLLERNPNQDAWWRYWAPSDTRTGYRLLLALHFVVALVIGTIVYSLFDRKASLSIAASIGKGLAYGIAAQALLKYDAGTFAGPARSSLTLSRFGVKAVGRWIDSRAIAEASKEITTLSDRGLVRFVSSLAAAVYSIDLDRPPKLGNRLVHDQLASWTCILTGRPDPRESPSMEAYLPATPESARGLLEEKAIELAQATVEGRHLVPAISRLELQNQLQ